jgi:methionine sulfoxide reductase catalytic subunit
MLIKRRRGWELREAEATPEALFFNRRELIGGALALGSALTLGAGEAAAQHADPTFDLYPAKRNERFAG